MTERQQRSLEQKKDSQIKGNVIYTRTLLCRESCTCILYLIVAVEKALKIDREPIL